MIYDSGNRGGRLEANRVKVHLGKNGQYRITFPKVLGKMMNLENGSVIEFILLKSGSVKIEKVR